MHSSKSGKKTFIFIAWPYATARVGSGGAILSREIRGSKNEGGKEEQWLFGTIFMD